METPFRSSLPLPPRRGTERKVFRSGLFRRQSCSREPHAPGLIQPGHHHHSSLIQARAGSDRETLSMNGLIRFSLRNPRAITVFTLTIMLAGAVALTVVPADILPVYRSPAV